MNVIRRACKDMCVPVLENFLHCWGIGFFFYEPFSLLEMGTILNTGDLSDSFKDLVAR